MFDKHDSGSGYGAGLLIVIVLVVLFAAFARGGWGGGDGYGHGCGNNYPAYPPYPYPPVYAQGHEGKGRCEGFADAFAIRNSTDDTYAKLSKEVCKDTGQVIHDLDIQTCQIKGLIRDESCKTDGLVMAEARRAEERSYRAELDQYRDKLAQERLANSELRNQNLYEKTLMAIERNECKTLHKLDNIQCEMLKRPPLYPHVYLPSHEECGGQRREYPRPYEFPVREVIREAPLREVVVHGLPRGEFREREFRDRDDRHCFDG